MNKRLDIDELLKSRLEGMEYTPSEGVWEKTRRTFRRKEFMRFRANKFNIYYAAGILVTGAAIVAAVLTGDADVKHVDPAVTDTLSIEKEEVANAVDSKTIAPDDTATSENDEIKQDAGAQDIVRDEEKETEDAALKTSDKENIKEDKEDARDEEKPSSYQNEEIPGESYSSTIAYFTLSTKAGCVPLTITFNNHSINASHVQYSFGDGELAEYIGDKVLNQVTHTYTEPGTYLVNLTITNKEGLQKTDSRKITVHPRPVSDFETYRQTDEDQLGVLNYSQDALEYAWWISYDKEGLEEGSVSLISKEYQPQFSLEEISKLVRGGKNENGSIYLVTKNQFGCTDTAESELPLPSSPGLVFPNAFSPNPAGPSDGSYNMNDPNNDIFHPVFSEIPVDYHLQIFNKSGELIFETEDIHTGWDGYHKEAPVARGVFIWKCTGQWKNGDPIAMQGDVTVLWNS